VEDETADPVSRKRTERACNPHRHDRPHCELLSIVGAISLLRRFVASSIAPARAAPPEI
jgi:hypothetical protein